MQNLNRTKFSHQNFFYNVHSLHFSVGHILMIASPSKEWPKVSMRSKVRGFDGTFKVFKKRLRVAGRAQVGRCWKISSAGESKNRN
jgi:hypothetical protein